MPEYVFSLHHKDSRNWEICKSESLIGVRGSRHAQTRAQQVQFGDTVYVWRGGGASRRGSGLIAKLSVAGPAHRAVNPPWPDPELYTFVIPIANVLELATPVPDRFPSNREGTRFRVQNSAVQQGLQIISSESAALMEACFVSEGLIEPPQQLAVSTSSGGWSTDQALIRRVERAAIEAARQQLQADGWYEIRDCQQDGCGYDLLYGRGTEELLVEVKGTAGGAKRFVLTRLEHQVLSSDPRARVYLVLDALGAAPRGEVLDWRAVSALGILADRWRVGG
ncbi:DUF3883 domain-containing protein [Nocardia sp. KC 131]|uniref:DUF3883 domain-containing protein n=1 Tax=Nocardia arseniciresistens TaxID=3392119 RepID=UPI00398E7C7C